MFKNKLSQKIRCVIAIVLTLTLTNLSPPVYASTNDTNSSVTTVTRTKLTTEEIAKESSKVVYIVMNDVNGKPYCSGSGFITDSSGIVVTNYHVIDGNFSGYAQLESGVKYDIQSIIAYSKDKDLAVLKLKGASNLPTVTLGDSSLLVRGEDIVAIGSPKGYINTISTGIISNFVSGQMRTGSDLLISASISHGSSGGAVFNEYGEVIGISYASRVDGELLNFAIPINDVKDMLKATTSFSFNDVYKSTHGSIVASTPTSITIPSVPTTPSNPSTTSIASATKDNVTILLNKVVQDTDSLKIYVTYTNNSTNQVAASDCLAKIEYGGNTYKYDIDFNFDRFFMKTNIPHSDVWVQPGTSEQSIIFYKPIDLDKINIIISSNWQEFKFNDIIVSK